MARVVNWSWKEADRMVGKASRERVLKAANVIADRVRSNCPEGSVSRPIYSTGKYAGQPWTARDAGQLKRSVRVVERDTEKYGFALEGFGNVRIYAGHYLAYYARIVEYHTPFMRPAVESSRGQVKDILENG